MSKIQKFRNIALTSLIAGVFAGAPVFTPNINSYGPDAANAAGAKFNAYHSLERINATRSQHGAKPLQMDDRLMKVAQEYAELMGRTGKFAHRQGAGSGLWTRVRKAGFPGRAGENLAAGYRNIDGVIVGWLNSPSHRSTLLKKSYRKGGVGFYPNVSGKNTDIKHFWVFIAGG